MRSLLIVGLSLAMAAFATASHAQAVKPYDARLDKSIAQLQAELKAGKTTSERLVRDYLKRIEAFDRKGPAIRAIVTLNPEALRIARDMDRERKAGKIRGPLHGIPVLLKDNIETIDLMPTTAGSLALEENFATKDAPIAANLRAAGAIILGKANLSEWANFRSDDSLSGWSAVVGLTKNPHVLDRSACGSSSGSAAATAALFAVASVGTETDGSITCPSSMVGLVGLKPTVGLLPQQGIVPISHSQDTAGPMTRSVPDAAAMLAAMAGNHAQCSAQGCKPQDYVALLANTKLSGKRIGVWRFKAGRHPRVDVLYETALNLLGDAGAALLDVQVPDTTRINVAEMTVLLTEFKADLNAYLASTPDRVRVRTLDQLIAFNAGTPRELVLFGQELFVRANAAKSLDDPSYRTALADGKRLAGAEGIARILAADRLDFIVAPTTGPTWRIDTVGGDQFPGSFSTLPAVSGYPHLTVPMGTIQGLPIGLSFIGGPWTEAVLLGVANDYEERAGVDVRAAFKPSLEADSSPALGASD